VAFGFFIGVVPMASSLEIAAAGSAASLRAGAVLPGVIDPVTHDNEKFDSPAAESFTVK
jgi:hypothetical protein